MGILGTDRFLIPPNFLDLKNLRDLFSDLRDLSVSLLLNACCLPNLARPPGNRSTPCNRLHPPASLRATL